MKLISIFESNNIHKMPKVSIGQYSELSGYISGKRINRKASEREKKRELANEKNYKMRKTRQTKTKFCVQLKRCQFSFVLRHSTKRMSVWTFQLCVKWCAYINFRLCFFSLSLFLFVRSYDCHFLQRYS